jgi:hypothetical protein
MYQLHVQLQPVTPHLPCAVNHQSRQPKSCNEKLTAPYAVCDAYRRINYKAVPRVTCAPPSQLGGGDDFIKIMLISYDV